ncbi:virion structural protein [Alcaligenes phage vB_Af_QDWS595]|uniref:Structural protein n=1 Tax=Alcaligenes phage vB_Af_QDWS595 TaxID=2877946 RepID=A0AAE8Y4G5_9CAUD|nr:virion structural protein [Alcaligenes phage vB_Af_QDWS595]UCR75504.1 putative structural protein [Alcaligenes phage vB_Af_QDWS595]
MSCGIENEANDLMKKLLQGEDFTIPDIDLDSPDFKIPEGSDMYEKVKALTNADLTTGEVGGTGTFDVLAESVKKHLKEQFDSGNIAESQLATTYIALMESAMANSVQFLLNRDQAYWQSQLAQIQAITAQVQMKTALVQLVEAQLRASTLKSEFALNKARLASESKDYCIKDYTLTNMLPAQLEMVNQQVLGAKEQMETARAQTMDTRTDGTPISGSVGKQKELYSQQITSYQWDAKIKVAKQITDSWTVQKTIDEGLNPPNVFTNPEIDTTMNTLKTDVGL